jgi:hypothetical protein
MPASAPVSPPSPWAPVALRAGLVAGILGSACRALGYYLANPNVPSFHSWPVSVAAILLGGALSGASLGLTICGGIVLARRRGGRAVHVALAAAGGGVVGSLVPSGIGVLGFGSLSTPYIGTDIAAIGVLVAGLLLGTLLSLPAATGRAAGVSRRAAFVCSLLASVLVIIPFGATIAGIVVAVLPFAVIRQIFDALHAAITNSSLILAVLSVGAAVIFGALFGAFIGLASNLAALLRESWALMRSRAR